MRNKKQNFIILNKKFENSLTEFKGRKVLYAHCYYNEVDFWQIYDKTWYNHMRDKYFVRNLFPTVYEKSNVKSIYKTSFIRGVLKLIFWNKYLKIKG
jgi:hypothetical protein